MNLIINFLKKNPKIWISLTILLVLFIAYGQTLQMYFWQDDFALLFKLQHPQGAAGSYGTGIIGQGPYKYFITMFVPFFPIFQMNPFWYFFVGFLTYLIGLIIFYFFTKELFQNKKAAIISSLIYAAGYIGSDTAFRISNYWQTNAGIILALLSILFYTRFVNHTKNIKYYILGILFFFFATEFVFVRSHSLIVPILAVDILILMIPFKINKLPGFILRQSLFLLIFYYKYFGYTESGGNGLKSTISQILSGKISILASFFATIGNIFIPDKLQNRFIEIFQSNSLVFLLIIFLLTIWFLLTFFKASTKAKIIAVTILFLSSLLSRYYEMANLYWYRTINSFVSGAIGLYFSILILSISGILWKKQRSISNVLIFGFIILTSQIFSYYIQYPLAIFNSTHRYLSYAFIGYSLIFGALGYLFFERILKIEKIPENYKKFIALISLAVIIIPNLILGFYYQKNIIENRSLPTKNFYEQLLTFVPSVNKGALFYFDIYSEKNYEKQFQEFFSVGSMPNQTALAVFYNVDRYDLSLITNMNELLFNLDSNKNKIDNIYTFYYGPGVLNNIGKNITLINTTPEVRNLLKNGSKEELIQGNTTNNRITFKDIKTYPATPILLNLKMEVIPDFESINKITKQNKFNKNTTQELLKYLMNRNNYYQDVKATSLSEWRYQEIYNLIDNDLQTSWRGSRIYWHDNKHEQVTLDLGSVQNISQLIWTNWNNTLTPTAYTIEVSLDNKNWVNVKKVINGPERKNGEVVFEEFYPASANFIRMDITSTISNDAPALKEIEVVKTEDNDIDINSASDFASDPLSHIASQNEINTLLSQIVSLINIDVEIKTNKTVQIKQAPVKSFQNTNSYEFILTPGGTQIENIYVKTSNLPSNLRLISASIRNLSFSEIQERGLIKYLTK